MAVLRLDDFDLPHCRLLKVDVEGMELSVLKRRPGAWSRGTGPCCTWRTTAQEKSDALVRFIAALGYDLYWHCPYLYNPGQLLRQPGERVPEHRVLQHVLRPQ